MKELSPGDIFGDFRVVRRLGRGGMGEVWLLEPLKEGVSIAAKILGDKTDRDERRRFAHEAEMAIDMRHGNVVETYDVGEDPDTGAVYILMEYMAGGSLADRIKKEGKIPVEDSLRIVQGIARALTAANEKGIVHRDIKPANIMFTGDGVPKLADLGIAKGTSYTNTTLTKTGMVLGTPAYMAPEQMLDSHSADTRSDIYSLGVVLYEMLTGERPNKDDSVVQLMAKAIYGEPIPDIRTVRPDIPEEVAQLIEGMTAPDMKERIGDPKMVVSLCRRILAGEKVGTGGNRGRFAWPRSWARRGIAAAGIAAIVFGMAFSAHYLVAGRTRTPAVAEAPPSAPTGVIPAGNSATNAAKAPVSQPAPTTTPVETELPAATEIVAELPADGKLPVKSMPKNGLMVSYDYNDGAAVNTGYGAATVLREDVSYRDGVAVFDGKYQSREGEDVVIPGFNYDHFTVALSFMPDKEWLLKNDSNEMLIIGTCSSRKLGMAHSRWNGDHVCMSFSDSRAEQISLPIEIDKWNWVVLSVDVKRRLATVAVNGKLPVERILPDDFHWMIPADKISGDYYRRLHFGNANRGVRYCGSIDDLMVYDRALTRKEMLDITRGVPYMGSAKATPSADVSLAFRKPALVPGKWVFARQPEISQYWNGTISTGNITLGAREDKGGIVVEPIGRPQHETIDLSLPVVDANGRPLYIYAIGGHSGHGLNLKTTTIRLPQTLRELRSFAFAGCRKLKAIEIPECLETIGNHAFCCCCRIESIVIPEHVREIGERAFYSCGSLQKIKIQSRHFTMAKDAFGGSTPIGSVMPKGEWNGEPVTKESSGDPAFAYAKDGRRAKELWPFINGWANRELKTASGTTPPRCSPMPVGPGFCAGVRLVWYGKVDGNGMADDAATIAAKVAAILEETLKGKIESPKIMPRSQWPDFGAMGSSPYTPAHRASPIGSSKAEIDGYRVKIDVFGGTKDKNVAVVAEVVDTYMYKAWGAPLPDDSN